MPNYPLTEKEREILKEYVSAWESVENKTYLRQIRKRLRNLDLDLLQRDVDLIKRVKVVEEENAT